ncbi:MAG: hypothetical protein AAFS01_03385 [Pseudomonadota bacterium]
MTFARDIEAIETVVCNGDPAFEGVARSQLDHALLALKTCAGSADKDGFLLAAMQVVALAGNGHSRLIPNPAIRVVPCRIVIRDGDPVLVEDGRAHRILAVDGVPSEQLLAAWSGLLAGNPARQRVLSGIMMAWPAALRRAGAGHGRLIRYQLDTGAERVFPAQDVVPALQLFPVAETGALDPLMDDHGLPGGSLLEMRAEVWWWRIADLKALETEQVAQGVSQMSARPGAHVVIDLRGNPGGSFLNAMPLIDWLRAQWRGARCAVLVDAYTFSAAIVTAALLAHHLGPRAQVFGGDMGDDLAFFAEGGTIVLQDTGAHLRHATARHDWDTGRVAPSTPPEIAAHLVAAGPLDVTQIKRANQAQTALAFVRGA